MEILKLIIRDYGPSIAACCLMLYLCFFTKKSVNGNEKKLKDDLATVIRENAELKVKLKEYTAKLDKKVDDLKIEVSQLMEEADRYVTDNEELKD